MAKRKRSKRGSAEKKKPPSKGVNPFEVHINREKVKIIGKKGRTGTGLPGISRLKALKKRNATLLKEFKLQNKVNKVLDNRIGESSKIMTDEDRKQARYTAVRAKTYNKKTAFNLSDETLTHHGQTLNEIERYEDPRSDEDDFEENGKLDANFVENVHFGGGMLSMSGKNTSHSDLIEELIIESKRRKAENQKLKNHMLQLTEKLDRDWKHLIPLVNKSDNPTIKSNGVYNCDDYNKTINELRFETRSHPSEPLQAETKSDSYKSKIIKHQKDDFEYIIEKSENESIRKGHRSADDLDYNFTYTYHPEVTLSYSKEGMVSEMKKANKNCDEEELSENYEVESAKTTDDDDGDSNGEDVNANLSDLKSSESENEDESIFFAKKGADSLDNKYHSASDNHREILKDDKNQLPCSVKLPNSYEDLHSVLNTYSYHNQSHIIERIIQTNHPSLGEENKQKLNNLFMYLLQYMDNIACDIRDESSLKNCIYTFKALVPRLLELIHWNKENTCKAIIEMIKEKQQDYQKHKKLYPHVELLLFLKLIGCLFSASKLYQQMITPCVIFIDQILVNSRVQTRKDISFALFLVTLILEYSSPSKRFLPSAIIFLCGIIHMAIPKHSIRLIKVLPPFKHTSNDLVLLDDHSRESQITSNMELTDLLNLNITEDFKIRSLYTAMKLLREFNNLFSELPSCCEIFEMALRYLNFLPLEKYPEEMKYFGKNLIDIFNKQTLNRKLNYIVAGKKQPKALRLYEPDIKKIFDDKRRTLASKCKRERSKLLHKVRREHKGALREIRKDSAFLSKLKINQHLQSDKERYEKVKKIYTEANAQQSELNSLQRKKNKLKLKF